MIMLIIKYVVLWLGPDPQPQGAFLCSGPNIFLSPQIFCAQKILFQLCNKNKNLATLKMCFTPPNRKTWLRACLGPETFLKLRFWFGNRWTKQSVFNCVSIAYLSLPNMVQEHSVS